MKKFKTLFLVPAILFAYGACTTTSTPEDNANASQNTNEIAVATPAPTAADDVTQGKKLFLDNCARCHKEDGTGGPVEIEGQTIKPDNLTTEKMSKEPDEEYLKYIENGIADEGMPSFKDVLSKDEMNHVVKYIRKELQKQ